MPKEEVIGFVDMSAKEITSLDGIPCKSCGAIMVRKDENWFCETCGATTGCTEGK